MSNNQNPKQNPDYNLPAAAAVYAVGGMATHWTAATPREHPTIERSDLLTDKEWDSLYSEAEAILKTNRTMFDHSIRNTVVKETLQKTYSHLISPETQPQNLPLAGERREHAPELINWSGGDTVLGEELIDMLKKEDPNKKFTLKVIHKSR